MPENKCINTYIILLTTDLTNYQEKCLTTLQNMHKYSTGGEWRQRKEWNLKKISF